MNPEFFADAVLITLLVFLKFVVIMALIIICALVAIVILTRPKKHNNHTKLAARAKLIVEEDRIEIARAQHTGG